MELSRRVDKSLAFWKVAVVRRKMKMNLEEKKSFEILKEESQCVSTPLHVCTLSITHSLFHTHTFSLTLFHIFTLSLSHTHTHTLSHTISLSHTHTNTQEKAVAQSQVNLNWAKVWARIKLKSYALKSNFFTSRIKRL